MAMSRGRYGRWGAVTTLSPLRRGWSLWLRAVPFAIGSRTTLLARPLVRQRVIALGRWTLLPRRGRPPVLLFETNWAGTWQTYIDDFARVMPVQWWSIWGGAEGFPGPLPVTDLLRFIDERDHGVDHFYCAYPDGTTQDVLRALELPARLARFRRDTDGLGPQAFAARWDALLDDVQEAL